MNDKGPGNPQAVALLRAKEVADKGVDMANNSEPFFFYNGVSICTCLLNNYRSEITGLVRFINSELL